jgi:hypothetical protein
VRGITAKVNKVGRRREGERVAGTCDCLRVFVSHRRGSTRGYPRVTVTWHVTTRATFQLAFFLPPPTTLFCASEDIL